MPAPAFLAYAPPPGGGAGRQILRSWLPVGVAVAVAVLAGTARPSFNHPAMAPAVLPPAAAVSRSLEHDGPRRCGMVNGWYAPMVRRRQPALGQTRKRGDRADRQRLVHRCGSSYNRPRSDEICLRQLAASALVRDHPLFSRSLGSNQRVLCAGTAPAAQKQDERSCRNSWCRRRELNPRPTHYE
jgi:hypothetical protein